MLSTSQFRFANWECLQLFATGNKNQSAKLIESHHLARSNVLFKHSSASRCEEINMNLKLQLKILSFLQFCLWEVG